MEYGVLSRHPQACEPASPEASGFLGETYEEESQDVITNGDADQYQVIHPPEDDGVLPIVAPETPKLVKRQSSDGFQEPVPLECSVSETVSSCTSNSMGYKLTEPLPGHSSTRSSSSNTWHAS
jgi:hypothetical protein